MERAVAADISAVFGGAFATAISDVSPGAWSGPIRSSLGSHLVHVTWKGEPVIPALAQLHDVVLREWTHAHTVDSREQLYRSLRKRYTVTIAPAPVGAIAGGHR